VFVFLLLPTVVFGDSFTLFDISLNPCETLHVSEAVGTLTRAGHTHTHTHTHTHLGGGAEQETPFSFTAEPWRINTQAQTASDDESPRADWSDSGFPSEGVTFPEGWAFSTRHGSFAIVTHKMPPDTQKPTVYINQWVKECREPKTLTPPPPQIKMFCFRCFLHLVAS